MAYPFQTFTPVIAGRPKIVEAVEEIVTRHIDGESTTAIVAPPRYGKSNIIRLSGLELSQCGLTTAALALAPWEQIADQLVAVERTSEMRKRYFPVGDTSIPKNPVVYRAQRLRKFSTTFHETTSLTHLWTATIHLANNNIDVLEAWVSRCITNGARPIVYIDEGQLLSTGNIWGTLAGRLQDAGAHVVLLTGTPFRADKNPIPGFRVRELNREERGLVHRYVRLDDLLVEKITSEATDLTQKLEAQIEVTLNEAWTEVPPALVKLEPQWIASTGTIAEEKASFSELKPNQQRRYRRRVCTGPDFINESVKRGLTDLRARQQTHKECGMLIITASDFYDEDEDDGLANYHARKYRDAILAQDATLKVGIATQASDSSDRKSVKAKHTIQDFLDGKLDILIVKNMGIVGLDAPRIKTVILAATFRQWAIWLQSILRGATILGNVGYMTLILLDDAENQQNWQTLIVEQGGNYARTVLTEIERTIIESQKDVNPPPDGYEPTGAVLSKVSDSHNQDEIDGIESDAVYRVITAYPIYRERFSQVEIAKLIAQKSITVPERDSVQSPGVSNVGDECASIAIQLEQAARHWADIKSRGADRSVWLERKKEISSRAKQIGGLRAEPSKETDPSRLNAALRFVNEQIAIANGIATRHD